MKVSIIKNNYVYSGDDLIAYIYNESMALSLNVDSEDYAKGYINIDPTEFLC